MQAGAISQLRTFPGTATDALRLRTSPVASVDGAVKFWPDVSKTPRQATQSPTYGCPGAESWMRRTVDRAELQQQHRYSITSLPEYFAAGETPPAPATSDSSAPSGSLVINVNSDFVGGVRAALHVIDEGTQLRHHLPAAGIVEKHTRRHGREGFQHVHEFPRFHRAGSDRIGHLRKAQSFDGCAKHCGHVVSDKRS
jgi:hypothetical protein